MASDELVEIGYVIKTHGVKGFLRISFHENIIKLNVSDALFFMVKGNKIPFFIKGIEYLDNGNAFVLLEEINTKEHAERFTKKPVWGKAALFGRQDDEEQILTNYMNYKVVHEEGEIGTVSNFYEMQEYDIIEVDMRGKLIMIPVHDETIISVDDNNKILKLKLPEGLLDVF